VVFSAGAFTFVLLVLISGIKTADYGLHDIYFMKVNATNITTSNTVVPGSGATVGSIAQSIGLHDFYQNSLWGYCEGNSPNGSATYCSPPTPMYVFDPIDIFETELYAGNNITIPAKVQDYRDKGHTISRWLFALYLVGCILAFITLLIGLTTLCSLLGSMITTFVSLVSLIFVGAASILAQVGYIVYRNTINDVVSQWGVRAELGTAIFAFSWAASVCALLAFIGFAFGMCCGTGDRPRRGFGARRKYSKSSDLSGVRYT